MERKKDRLPRRVGMMLAMLPIMSLGVVLLEEAGLGNGPFNGMCISLSRFFGLPLGNLQLMVNLALFVLMLLFKRDQIWLGTLANAAGLGYCTQFLQWLWGALALPSPQGLGARLLFMALGIAALGLACSLYFVAGLGIAPFDALAFILQEKLPFKAPFFACRISTDLACVLVIFATGGVLGVGTVIDAFCLGPFISFFNRTVSEPLLAAGRP